MYLRTLLLAGLFLTVASCGSTASSSNIQENDLEANKRVGITLMDQIRRLPGISMRNGVPIFVKSTSSINPGVPIEPLYVLNGYVLGNSFRDVDQLVDNVNVEKIEVLTDSEASFYGSRAANGVILITTRQ